MRKTFYVFSNNYCATTPVSDQPPVFHGIELEVWYGDHVHLRQQVGEAKKLFQECEKFRSCVISILSLWQDISPRPN